MNKELAETTSGAPNARSEARLVADALSRDLAARGRTGQLVVWNTTYARAYVYCGEWVADCPQQDCGNVEFLTLKLDRDRGVAGTVGERKDAFFCSYCKCMATSVHWPADAEEIVEVLDRRPRPHTRNWYPEGHLTALKFNVPDGQTIAELKAENAAHGVE